jgi:hypothetical protein
MSVIPCHLDLSKFFCGPGFFGINVQYDKGVALESDICQKAGEWYASMIYLQFRTPNEKMCFIASPIERPSQVFGPLQLCGYAVVKPTSTEYEKLYLEYKDENKFSMKKAEEFQAYKTKLGLELAQVTKMIALDCTAITFSADFDHEKHILILKVKIGESCFVIAF